ncbi:MAG: DNA replication/repair protein RecF [Eubacteriales bacterium]|nr:DNA replication/repair protein RecF [Eubacteriales bacterium]
MIFTSLRLAGFRNYQELCWTPHPGTTVLYGANGSGKTNLLEAMHLLSLGRSHRTSADREMIAQGADMALVRGETRRLDGRHDIEIRLYPMERQHKRVLLFGKPAERIGDLMGHATCVLFAPEDLRIVRDGPAARRRFIDMQLSQIRPAYLAALKRYLNVLDSRNALLKRQRGTADFAAQLDTWDEQLAAAAGPVADMRRWFVEALSARAAEQYAAISENPEERLEVRYAGPLAQAGDAAEKMLEGLRRTRGDDLQRYYTHFGPHRDDMTLLLRGKELRAYGSQGQVRTAVLSLKLGELPLIEHEMGETPALLLDDVFSELDARRRGALLQSAAGAQTVITCTDKADAAGAKADVFFRVSQQQGRAILEEG